MFLWIICGITSALLVHNVLFEGPKDTLEKRVALAMSFIIGFLGPIGLITIFATMIDFKINYKY